jgi:hypothetical protein
MTVTQRRAVIAIDEPTGAGARSDDVLANGQIVYMPTGRGAEVGTV